MDCQGAFCGDSCHIRDLAPTILVWACPQWGALCLWPVYWTYKNLCDCASKDKPRISSSWVVIVLPALVHWLFAGPWWSWRRSSSLRPNKMNICMSWAGLPPLHESPSESIVAPTCFISKSHSALVLTKDIYYIFYVSKLHRIKCICLQSSGNGSLVQCDLACDRKHCWVSSPFLLLWSFQPRSVVYRL